MTRIHAIDAPGEQLGELRPFELNSVVVETLKLARNLDECVSSSLKAEDDDSAGGIAVLRGS